MHMDSDFALWYVRARLNTSDFDRTRRAQEVIQAIAHKALSPAYILRLPSFVESTLDVVETDMTTADMWLYAFPLSKFFQKTSSLLIVLLQMKLSVLSRMPAPWSYSPIFKRSIRSYSKYFGLNKQTIVRLGA